MRPVRNAPTPAPSCSSKGARTSAAIFQFASRSSPIRSTKPAPYLRSRMSRHNASRSAPQRRKYRLIGNRDAEQGILNRGIDISCEGEMKSALSGREDRRLGIRLFQPHRDPIGIDNGLAAIQRKRGHHDLSRCGYEFLALQIVDFDDFVVDPLVVEDLADLRTKWAGAELEEPCRHRVSASASATSWSHSRCRNSGSSC